MSDSPTVEGPVPAPPGAPPKWMLLVGCGCLVPGFLFISAAAYFMQMMGGLLDQKSAWESLAQLIEYDEALKGTPSGQPDNPKTSPDESRTPAEFAMQMGGEMPISKGREEFYWLGRDVALPVDEEVITGPDPLQVTFAKLPSTSAEAATRAPNGTPKHEDRSIEVQGQSIRMRTIPEMVTKAIGVPFLFHIKERRGAGAAVWVRKGFADEKDDGKTFDLIVFFMRPGSSRPIEPDEVRHFLKGYRIPLAGDTTDEDGPGSNIVPVPSGDDR